MTLQNSASQNEVLGYWFQEMLWEFIAKYIYYSVFSSQRLSISILKGPLWRDSWLTSFTYCFHSYLITKPCVSRNCYYHILCVLQKQCSKGEWFQTLLELRCTLGPLSAFLPIVHPSQLLWRGWEFIVLPEFDLGFPPVTETVTYQPSYNRW